MPTERELDLVGVLAQFIRAAYIEGHTPTNEGVCLLCTAIADADRLLDTFKQDEFFDT